MTRSLLELFSGSGVLSARFREGGWSTREVELTRGEDVMTFEPEADYDVVFGAPPCGEYSGLRYDYSAIWSADRALWLRTLELVQQIKPRYWIIENVKMAQWLWGRAVCHYGQIFLWGWFPPLVRSASWRESQKGTHFSRSEKSRWNEDRTSAERATYPPDFCDTMFETIERGFKTGYQPRLYGGAGEARVVA